LALNLGLVHQWYEDCRAHDLVRRRAAFANLGFASYYEPCRRVAGDMLLRGTKDSDPDVRVSACRGVALSGDEEQIEYLFALAIRADVLARLVLTEDLRRHATSLATGPVREALASGDTALVRATLEILVAWARAIPLEELGEFLDHRDRDIRILAFRLASFVPLSTESRLALLRSLRSADTEIRGLAVVAAGRQKIVEAIPELAICLEREGLEQARQAATALAAMPPDGWQPLQELSANPNPVTALAAGEALARARKGL
jgi:HEAT repeat protein